MNAPELAKATVLVVDRAPQVNGKEWQRADIANRRESSHQRGVHMIDGPCSAQGQPFMHHLIVPGSLVIGVQQDVGVSLDHPRHERRARQVDDGCSGGIHARTRLLDSVALYQHHPTFVQRFAIEHARRLQQDRCSVDVAAAAALRHRRHLHQNEKPDRQTLSHYAIIAVRTGDAAQVYLNAYRAGTSENRSINRVRFGSGIFFSNSFSTNALMLGASRGEGCPSRVAFVTSA